MAAEKDPVGSECVDAPRLRARRVTTVGSPTRLVLFKRIELLALLVTIPAFYWSLLSLYSVAATLLYGLAAIVCTVVWWQEHRPLDATPAPRTARRLSLGPALAIGLLASAVLPSGEATAVVAVRLGVAGMVLLRAAESLRPWFWRTELPRYLALAIGVFALCGLGFWWLEPQVHDFGDALWLAFTTAATVGYGDVVPTTPASKIFAVFVVLLGVAVLSLVTAAIAASWVQTEERRIEQELLRDLHAQLGSIRGELESMRKALDRAGRENQV